MPPASLHVFGPSSQWCVMCVDKIVMCKERPPTCAHAHHRTFFGGFDQVVINNGDVPDFVAKVDKLTWDVTSYASCTVQHQSDGEWGPIRFRLARRASRTPHGGASYAWCLTA